MTVADSQDWYFKIEDLFIYFKWIWSVDALWSSGEDYSCSIFKFFVGSVMGLDDGVNTEASDPIGNEVSILAAEVENGDGGWLRVYGWVFSNTYN